MTKPAAFTKAAVTRAVEAVKAGGETVSAVEFRPDGSFKVLTIEPPASADEAGKVGSSWDRVFAA